MNKPIISINLRLPTTLHQALRERAAADQRSLNNLIVRLLARQVRERKPRTNVKNV